MIPFSRFDTPKNHTQRTAHTCLAHIWAICLNIYCFVLSFCLLLHRLDCRKDQFAVLYFSTSLIVLIQVYNWEIRHHSLVSCCGFADILNIMGVTPGMSIRLLRGWGVGDEDRTAYDKVTCQRITFGTWS